MNRVDDQLLAPPVAAVAVRGFAPADRDCWVVPIDGGTPVDTTALRRARQRELFVISMAIAWTGDSIFFTAAAGSGRVEIHFSYCGVITSAGSTQFTRIPCFARSSAHSRVREFIAPFEAT